jgi:23S rRNA pseudouridine955/2504/2580 synthase
VSDEGKRAGTRFRLSRRYGEFSLMQCQPLSGRTHQVRVHAQLKGHPLVVDERYGNPQANNAAKAAGLRRLFLHAQSIAFPDDSGNEQHFTAPLADDLQLFLSTIEKRSTPHARR